MRATTREDCRQIFEGLVRLSECQSSRVVLPSRTNTARDVMGSTLPLQLSEAQRAFSDQLKLNLLAAPESLKVLVDLTSKLRTELSTVGGPLAGHLLEGSPRDTPQLTSSLYQIVEETVQAISEAYGMYTAAHQTGKLKKELKHFQTLLQLSTFSCADALSVPARAGP